jgi:hypothetical protein
MGNSNSCNVNDTPTKGQGCPPGFKFTYDCESSWVFWKKPNNARCEIEDANADKYSADWPAGLSTDYDAPIIQGSRYTTAGDCSGSGTTWEDKSDVAPSCLPGDTEISTRESPCGSHLFGTYGSAGGKQIRTCANKRPSGSNPVISVQKRGANCAAGSGMTWFFDPEWSCYYKEEKGRIGHPSVIDCWIPYVVTSNEECIAYNPREAGWLRTYEDDGSELDGQQGRAWPRIEYLKDGDVELPVGGGGPAPVAFASSSTALTAGQKVGTTAVFMAPAAVIGAVFFKKMGNKKRADTTKNKLEMRSSGVV